MYKEVLEKSITLWLGTIVRDVMPSLKNTAKTSMINNIMGALLGVDLGRYNIMSELSFLMPQLIEPQLKSGIDSFVNTLGLSDGDIPGKVQELLILCKTQADKKGSINIFGIEFTTKSFQKFEEIWRTCLSNTNMNQI